MPLLYQKAIAPDALLGVWEMKEAEQELLLLHPFLHRHIAHLDTTFRHAVRRQEFLSVRALLSLLIHDDTIDISYTANRQPLLSDGRHISISHTRGYAAVLVSTAHHVGIDIERKGRNIRRVTSHFLRHDEQADTDDDLLLHWCAKEAVYKLFPDDHLTTSEIKVCPPSADEETLWYAANLKRNVSVPLLTTDHPHFLLTCVIL